MFWPLALVAGIAYGLFVVARSVGAGFAALWRRARAERIPRATARRR
jgi:hypothetical protein